MGKNKMQLKEMVNIGMFTAVLAVLSILQIPMPSGIPITMQTFAVALCGCTLGWKKGAMAVIIYLLIGMIGFPVFAGMSGGLEVLCGLRGGFLMGFPIMAALCGLGMEKGGRIGSVVLGIAGLACCHLTGTLQFAFVSGRTAAEAFLLASAPYLIKDLISVAGAGILGAVLRKTLNLANIY